MDQHGLSRFLKIVSLFLLLLLAPLCLAQRKGLRFQNVGVEEGLASFFVSSVSQDADGFIWLGTGDGLNRYDGYQFKHLTYSPGERNSLTDRQVTCLIHDHEDILWVGTQNGLNRYDKRTEEMLQIPRDPKKENGLSNSNILSLLVDHRGQVWIGTQNGLDIVEASKPAKFREVLGSGRHRALRSNAMRSMLEDEDHQLWLGTSRGLHRYDPQTDKVTYVSLQSDPQRPVPSESISALADDGEGGIWVGTSYGLHHLQRDGTATFLNPDEGHVHGMTGRTITSIVLDKQKHLWVSTSLEGLFLRENGHSRFYNYRQDPGDANSLPNNQISTLFLDRMGNIWAGNGGFGVSHVDPSIMLLPHYRPQFDSGYFDEGVWCFEQESPGHFWVGSGSGLVFWDQVAGTFEHVVIDPSQPENIDANTVRSLCRDSKGRLWIGLRAGFAKMDPGGRTIRRYSQEEGSMDRSIRAIVEDREGTIWAGAYQAGLFTYDEVNDRFVPFTTPMSSGHVLSDMTRCLLEDKRHNLWIGTHEGLGRLDPDRKVLHLFFTQEEGKPISDRSRIMCMLESEHGLWLGTHNGGLAYFVPSTGELRYYSTEDGFPSNLIYGVAKDDDGALWLPTYKGLVRFDPETEKVTIFTTTHGLESDDFTSGSFAHFGKDFLVGGTKGFNAFKVADLMRSPPGAPTVITQFWLAGKAAELSRSDAPSPLQTPIQMATSINLNYNQNALSFDFAHLSYSFPERNKYAFKLEGFDDQWTEASAYRRIATYTNLAAKTYTFRVKGMGKESVWAEADPLQIKVRPAPWATIWAYILYVVLGLSLIGFYLQSEKRKLIQERKIVERLRMVDKLRDDFLANTSHELRTPLHGIIGLAESLRDGSTGPLTPATCEHLKLIISIGKRLSALVNDILDFSQLQTRNLTLQLKEVNVTRLVDVVFTLAAPLMGNKDLDLINDLDPKGLIIVADEDRLLQVLQNLVGNALKFTHSGHVRVYATHVEEQCVIHVEDTGIGIPPDKLELIFLSFRQVDENANRQYGGAGLGLAISSELVRLHSGSMWVSSEPEKGSTFSFSLPDCQQGSSLGTISTRALVEFPMSESSSLAVLATPPPGSFVKSSSSSQRILVVDDEMINCTILQNHLLDYQVVTAFDGASCLSLLDQDGPFDLVLLDVMMPRLSGYEVCRRIRHKYAASDLPVIFISARNQVTDLMNGFDCGANDYLTKPISKGELLSRVRTHLALRESHRNLEQRIAERTVELEQKNDEIIRAQKKLVMQEKMASLGSMASGIAHEIRNPLNFVHGLTLSSTELFEELKEIFNRPIDPAEAIEHARDVLVEMDQNMSVILKHARRANSIVENMMTLSREGGGRFQPIRLGALAEEHAKVVYKDFKRNGLCDVALRFDFMVKEPTVSLNPREMNRVMTNIFKNAFESIAEKVHSGTAFTPELTVWTKVVDGCVQLGICDNGMGIESSIQKLVFDPFFTTKPPDTSHIGLGLSIAYEIVTGEHEGELRLTSELGTFAEFVIVLALGAEKDGGGLPNL